MPATERRAFTRYQLPSMYTAIEVLIDQNHAASDGNLAGHAYDISEGGMRFELDQPLDIGSTFDIKIELPCGSSPEDNDLGSVLATADVVWVEEEDLDHPGPVRMACEFRSFARPGGKNRLMSRITSGRFIVAA